MKRILIAFFALLLLSPAFAEKDKHDHDHEAEDHQKEKKGSEPEAENHDEHGHDDHEEGEKEHDEHDKEEHGHDDHGKEEHGHDEHGSEEHEENSQVGPDKGILQASAEDGIQLSPEAEKNFGLTRVKASASGTTQIPAKAVVYAVNEVNLFRFRKGFYKRIDFERVDKIQDKITVRSKDIKLGDEIAVSGLGFLRIAEIAAFGGAPEGHSH